ncbi:restriction endonuclease subunit M [Salmonella enterica subsp. enterica serovar Claibornei]|nr:restriction endonuclease subunit M [Salmonella enterica subsp. enterica serovar Claibornei]
MTAPSTTVEPEVLSGQHDVICSTSIERIVSGRNAALQQIEDVIKQIAEISRLTQSIDGGQATDWSCESGRRYDCWLLQPVAKAMPVITRNIDRQVWRNLMQQSGMLALMDDQARSEWHQNLEDNKFPEISEANILSTFQQLHDIKAEVFERGVINVFKGLSWDYKNNSPCKFGKKIIVDGLVRYDRWGFHLSSGYRRNQLVDLERMLHLLDGKPVPDNRTDIARQFDAHISKCKTGEDFTDDYLMIRYFQKGSAHIKFLRPELVEKMNDIVARHYPGALPAR